VRLRADGWPKDSARTTASAALALVEGALLLARVSGQPSPLANAKRAVHAMVAAPPTKPTKRIPSRIRQR
jgi:TetR/AcrR family transcriptional repressor of lmrAB and yxaGH operons